MTIRKMMTCVFVLSLAAVACSTAATSKGEASTTRGELPRGCPLGVDGANVLVDDTADGIALTFTSPDRVAELRERAADAAAIHGPGARMGRGHGGTHGEGGQHGLQAMQLPPVRTAVDEVEGGARIRFVPVDPADRTVLATRIRERALLMSTTACK